MKRCPECGAKRFIATAYLIVGWVMDENGNFVEECDDLTVDAAPDDSTTWECAECGFSAPGYEFNCDK